VPILAYTVIQYNSCIRNETKHLGKTFSTIFHLNTLHSRPPSMEYFEKDTKNLANHYLKCCFELNCFRATCDQKYSSRQLVHSGSGVDDGQARQRQRCRRNSHLRQRFHQEQNKASPLRCQLQPTHARVYQHLVQKILFLSRHIREE